VQQTQALPGVGPWDNGQQYINTAPETPTSPSHSHLPWIIHEPLATLVASAANLASSCPAALSNSGFGSTTISDDGLT
jgi:hypothetical protein